MHFNINPGPICKDIINLNLLFFQYCIKTLHKYGQKSLDDLKLNLALSSQKIL